MKLCARLLALLLPLSTLAACGGQTEQGPGGTGQGGAGSGTAGSGQAGSAQAGQGGSAGQAGSGQAGSGQAGSGQAGSGQGGGGLAGQGGAQASSWGESPCVSCVQATCADAAAACKAAPDCASYSACVQACPLVPGVNRPVESCVEACNDPVTEVGKQALGQLNGCYKQSQTSPSHPCTKACSETGLLLGESPCWACVSAECSALITACNAADDCKALLSCALGCGQRASDPIEPAKGCTEGCGKPDSPQGGAALDGLGKCVEQISGSTCASACAPP